MSVITDALKKAEQEKQIRSKVPASADAALAAAAHPPEETQIRVAGSAGRNTHIKYTAIFLMLFAAAVIIYVNLSAPGGNVTAVKSVHHDEEMSAPGTPQASSRQDLREAAATGLQHANHAREPNRPALDTRGISLSGIMSSGTGYIAFINNQMVREGEMIDGFRVTKIELKHIEVEKDGDIAAIRLTR
ncbi:MAG: hypothetical protein ABH885_05795 [Candidatus Omnitrophota bacterium]